MKSQGPYMRVFAISDLHLDYPQNRQWLHRLPEQEYRQDVLILAGDISDSQALIRECFGALTRRFASVMYVPGNHDLWVCREPGVDSFDKLSIIQSIAHRMGVLIGPLRINDLAIVPLLGWYDYSFGAPGDMLRLIWGDYQNCCWPQGYEAPDIARVLSSHNPKRNDPLVDGAETVITFSHFLPRIDLMHPLTPERYRMLFPVMGSEILERQLRALGADIHIYGHSHVGRQAVLQDVTYINNAFGTPDEARHTRRDLLCVHTTRA